MRRRCVIVVWDCDYQLTVPGWPVYWSDAYELDFVLVNRLYDNDWFLPVTALWGMEWFYTGLIAGFRLFEGSYGPEGVPRPKYREIRRTARLSANGWAWWVDSPTPAYDPMAHE